MTFACVVFSGVATPSTRTSNSALSGFFSQERAADFSDIRARPPKPPACPLPSPSKDSWVVLQEKQKEYDDDALMYLSYLSIHLYFTEVIQIYIYICITLILFNISLFYFRAISGVFVCLCRDARLVLLRQLKGLLNKLTIEKFDRIYHQIITAGIKEADEVKALMKMVFEKALSQHHFIQVITTTPPMLMGIQ